MSVKTWVRQFSIGGPDADSSRDAEHGQQDHPPAGGGGTLAFRDDKQETMVVRPYPQVQTHSQPQALPQGVSIQAGTPVTVPAPPVHLQQGQPAVLTEGQMKVMIMMPKLFTFIVQHVVLLPYPVWGEYSLNDIYISRDTFLFV